MRRSLLLAFLMVALQLISVAQSVTLYGDCNYRGQTVSLRPGNYSAYQHGMRIYSLSSIVIPPGMVVNLFSQDHFRGHYISLTNSSSCLVDERFNDQMVSIQVMQVNYGYQQQAPVILYNRCNYSGKEEYLREGLNNTQSLAFITGQSVRIAPGYGVIFRKERRVGFETIVTNEEYRENTMCFPPLWGSTVKSAFVYRLDDPYETYWEHRPNQWNNFNDGAVVFSDVMFNGRYQMLQPGAYRNYQLQQIGERQISSIKIAPGYRAIVFSGSNFDGSSLEVRQSINNLHPNNWGNRIGSIIVERLGQPVINPNPPPPPPPPPPTQPVPPRPQPTNSNDAVVAYADAFFMGAAQVFTVGRWESYQFTGVGFKTISSIKIPPGYRVTVYDGPHLNGDFRVLSYTIDNFVTEGQGRWNDRIGSMIVERIR